MYLAKQFGFSIGSSALHSLVLQYKLWNTWSAETLQLQCLFKRGRGYCTYTGSVISTTLTSSFYISSSPRFSSDHMLSLHNCQREAQSPALSAQVCLSPCVCFWLSDTGSGGNGHRRSGAHTLPSAAGGSGGPALPEHPSRLALQSVRTAAGSQGHGGGEARSLQLMLFVQANAWRPERSLRAEVCCVCWRTAALVLTGRGSGREEVQPGVLRDRLGQFGTLLFCSYSYHMWCKTSNHSDSLFPNQLSGSHN